MEECPPSCQWQTSLLLPGVLRLETNDLTAKQNSENNSWAWRGAWIIEAHLANDGYCFIQHHNRIPKNSLDLTYCQLVICASIRAL